MTKQISEYEVLDEIYAQHPVTGRILCGTVVQSAYKHDGQIALDILLGDEYDTDYIRIYSDEVRTGYDYVVQLALDTVEV